jgi:hypothetical protein
VKKCEANRKETRDANRINMQLSDSAHSTMPALLVLINLQGIANGLPLLANVNEFASAPVRFDLWQTLLVMTVVPAPISTKLPLTHRHSIGIVNMCSSTMLEKSTLNSLSNI